MVDRLMKGMGVEELNCKEDLEKWAREHSVENIVSSLIATGVPAAPINSLKEVIDDSHVKHRGMIVSLEHQKAGTVSFPNHPIKYSVVKPEMRYPAPMLGQHNDEVLVELGYTLEQINDLRKSKVIT
jgi:formyl-CoA transferase